MTIHSSPILRTIALATVLAGSVLAPAAVSAQGRMAPPPAPRSTPVATPDATQRSTAIATTKNWTDEEYRLGAGDKLRVEVYREPQLSQSLQIRPDGKITLPLIGDVTAAGTTASDLRTSLTTALKEFVTNPVVTVIVTDALAAQIYIIGEVANPGAQIMQGPMTALQAIAQAGGLKEFAKKSDIRILRKTGNGRTTTLPFDYKQAINGNVEPMTLQPGDTVVVP